MRYEGMVYRPPSEASSLIVQVTVGCSHNRCRFCSMYKRDKFRVRSAEDIIADLRDVRPYYRRIRRIFLADGDAMCLSMRRLREILAAVKEIYPECERVGIYARARDLLSKTTQELEELRDAGVGIVYVGAESGNEQVLLNMNKGETREALIEGVRKAEEAGIAASVTFISGLGGKELMREHAEDSASMINEMRPTYASWLTLMVDPIAPIYENIKEGRFELLSPEEVLEEMDIMLSATNIPAGEPCIFRSNHASNYLSLKGDLPADKERMIAEVRRAKESPGMLKPEHFRAL